MALNMEEIGQSVQKMLADSGLTWVEKSLPETLKSDSGAISEWLKSMADKADTEEAKVKLARAAIMLSEFAGGKLPAEKAAPVGSAPVKPGAGKPPETDPAEPDADDAAKKKKKALALDDGDSTVVKIDGTGISITKGSKGGGSRMSKERLATLSEATKSTLMLLKDADIEAFKNIVASVATSKEFPAFSFGDSPSSEVRPTGTGTAEKPKSVSKTDEVTKREEELTEKLSAATAQMVEMQKRIETIEKARSPSTSLDGATENKNAVPVTKGNGFWRGVL